MSLDTSVLAAIDRWVEAGWLSQLNRAFARFLRELEPDAGNGVLWAGALVSHQLDRGEVCLDLKSLSQQPGLTLAIPSDEDWTFRSESAQAELSALKALALSQWQSDLRNSKLVSTGEGNTPLVLDGNRLYLRRYWHYQQTLDRCIQDRLAPARAGLPEVLRSQIDALFPDRHGRPDWQKIACVLALRSRFAIITGGPGTGKTTTLTKLLALLIQLWEQAPEARKPNILLAAPTGKASARVSESIANALKQLNVDDNIKESIPKKAGTLHRLLGSRPDTRRFKHNRHNRLAADIVIVDEASMIDLEMMASLLEALPDNAQLILLGDKDQLASVEAGSVMGDLCLGAENAAYDDDARAWTEHYAGERLPPSTAPGTSINQQTVMLRHSHRFGEHSGIGQLARAVNAGDSAQAQAILKDTAVYSDLLPAPAADYLQLRARPEADAADALLKKLVAANAGFDPEDKPNPGQGYGYYLDVIRNRPPAGDPTSYDAWAERVLAAFDAFQVLCALRRGRWGVEDMNRRIEAWLFPKRSPGLWYEGRPVMITRNDYNLGLMNGDIGIALYDHTGKLRVAFPTDDPLATAKIRWLSPLRLPDTETAFAITVHKSQGSEFKHVVLALPEIKSPVLTRELIYTGITRAKQNFTLLESREGVFDQAVKARRKNPSDSG